MAKWVTGERAWTVVGLGIPNFDSGFRRIQKGTLGLFSPWFFELSQRPYRRNQLRRSLFIELEDLKEKLVAGTYALSAHLAKIDREFFSWFESNLSESSPYKAELRKLLDLKDGQLEQFLQSRQPANNPMTLKKHSAPFLTANLGGLSLFSPEFQRLAVTVVGKLTMLHEEVDQNRFFFANTFDGGTPQNRQILHSNMQNSYAFIIRLCRTIVGDINALLVLKK